MPNFPDFYDEFCPRLNLAIKTALFSYGLESPEQMLNINGEALLNFLDQAVYHYSANLCLQHSNRPLYEAARALTENSIFTPFQLGYLHKERIWKFIEETVEYINEREADNIMRLTNAISNDLSVTKLLPVWHKVKVDFDGARFVAHCFVPDCDYKTKIAGKDGVLAASNFFRHMSNH